MLNLVTKLNANTHEEQEDGDALDPLLVNHALIEFGGWGVCPDQSDYRCTNQRDATKGFFEVSFLHGLSLSEQTRGLGRPSVSLDPWQIAAK